VTARGFALVVGGVASVVWGWHAGWPELTSLGAGAVALVVLCLLITGPKPRARLSVPALNFSVTRGQPAQVRLSAQVGWRRRWLRLVDGHLAEPRVSLRLPRGRGDVALAVPIDTSKRGRYPVGPFSLVHGDPWSIRRSVAARADGGMVTVRPRTHVVRRALLAQMTVAESDLSSRRKGDQHFFALREYVLGDEPRMVHWRSSARVGQLVVKQHVAAATSGTTVVLDTDSSAYGSDEKFGSGWVEERFEAAVEVAASVLAAPSLGVEQVHLVSTGKAASVHSADAGAVNGLLDTLAVVSAVAPVDAVPAEIPNLVKRTRCARVVVVTGTPSPALVDAAQRVRRSGLTVLMVRVGSGASSSVGGVKTLDVERAEELV
jgi:uncharacterized protein (DUF58 family)